MLNRNIYIYILKLYNKSDPAWGADTDRPSLLKLYKGDSSLFVLSRTGHFGYSSIHNSVNIIGRTFMLHLHGSCHIMCFNV